MAFQDFRQFLALLRQQGELIDIDRPVALDDVAKVMKQSYVQGGPAIMFNQNGTQVPLVAGIYSTRRKALLALEADEESIHGKLQAGLSNPIPPRLVEEAAPCQDVVLTGNAIDITRFPIPQYSPKDGGRYITPGIVVSKDPETGVADIGHYRFLILGKDTLSYDAQPFHRFGKHITKCQRMGIVPRAAVIIGVDPVLAYTCQMQVTDNTNDWYVAGGIRGEPVDLVKCKTIDIEVPATAELVIEFEIDLERLVSEGPLGEYTGYYTPAVQAPVARITAITHRKNPIFQGLLTGKPVTENHILKQIPFEASLLATMRRQFPTVERVSVRASAGVSFYVVVAMRPRFAGEARQAIHAAMSSNIRPKWVIVVDPDIDVHSSTDVEWAMAFRVLPHRDVFVADNLPSGPADPATITMSADGERISAALALSSAVGIDATLPFGETFSEVADVPGWQDIDVPELKSHRSR